MKKLIIANIIMVFLLAGVALGSSMLSFTDINAITNSASKDFASSYEDFWCEITDRAGDDDIVVTLQGTNLTSDQAWVDLTTEKTISNSTDGPDSSWQFQSQDNYARVVRLHVVSGAGVANTVSGKCGPGGR